LNNKVNRNLTQAISIKYQCLKHQVLLTWV
jgi:hypothetical protein